VRFNASRINPPSDSKQVVAASCLAEQASALVSLGYGSDMNHVLLAITGIPHSRLRRYNQIKTGLP